MFIVNPQLDTETLLAHACESLASANVMAMDLADHMDGPSRNSLLGIAQVIMLGELPVNRALDQLDPPVGAGLPAKAASSPAPPTKTPSPASLAPTEFSVFPQFCDPQVILERGLPAKRPAPPAFLSTAKPPSRAIDIVLDALRNQQTYQFC
jgi:hypothetical protein